MGSLIFVVFALAVGGVVALVAVAAVVVLVMRRGFGGLGGSGNDAGPRMPATAAWQAGAQGLAALGMGAVDAELYTMGVAGGGTLYVKAEIKDSSLLAWLHQTAQGGAIEQFVGSKTDVRPGRGGGSPFAQWAAASIAEPFAALPSGASLEVKAPEMPGDQFKLTLTSPMWSPQHPTLVARTLLTLNDAARRVPAEGMHAQASLPPMVQRWLAAAPAIEALGLRKIDAELFTLGFGRSTLYLSVSVRDGTARCWIEQAFAGGPLEQFPNTRVEVHPGGSGHGQLGQLVAATVRETFAALPKRASLTVRTPEMPGAQYELALTTPLDAPEHAALAVRVVMMLDEAVRRPSGAAHPPSVSPAVAHWMAASSAFGALGLSPVDAECWSRGPLFVQIDVRGGTVRGWLESTAPGGALEGFLRKEAHLRPGDAPSSELAQGVLGAIQGVFAALPRQALLKVKAPEIAGAQYSLELTSPIASPDHGPAVARVLMTLDDALRRVH